MTSDDADDARTTDDELRELDVSLLLRYGLSRGGVHRAALFGEGSVAGALQAEALGVQPRSVAYLGEVVRRGGTKYAAGLPEPLPGPEPAALAGEWLTTASSVVTPGDVDADETMARWLEAVASVLALRRESTAG